MAFFNWKPTKYDNAIPKHDFKAELESNKPINAWSKKVYTSYTMSNLHMMYTKY